MAAMGAVLSREEAIALVVSLIGRLEPRSESYEQDLAGLLRLGATLRKQAEHGSEWGGQRAIHAVRTNR
ncbi:hypothetical protein D3C71_1785900 [compost metagenome]